MSTLSATATAPSMLPEIIPIFPLTGVVLLPRARLPLNIFEPRYLAMVEDVLGQGRIIGMVQPNAPEGKDLTAPPVYNVGCAGRITSFTETDDGRLLISLSGVCRFRIAEELPMNEPYRQVRPDWKDFLGDLQEPPEETHNLDRKKLLGVLQHYFKLHGIAADWNAVQNTPNELLLSSLVMICPLAPNEKQALLETPTLRHRAEMLTALLEMATLPQAEAEVGMKH